MDKKINDIVIMYYNFLINLLFADDYITQDEEKEIIEKNNKIEKKW